MSSLTWIRRDLRLHDHLALREALNQGETTLVFVFDTEILKKLHVKDDRRITFIYQSLTEIEKELQKKNSSLVILYGDPAIEIPKLAQQLKVNAVFCNRDYEPYAVERDKKVNISLSKSGIEFHQFKDSVIYEKHEVLSQEGKTYKVFTAYKNKWIQKFESEDRLVPDYKPNLRNLRNFKNPENILEKNWYKVIGFEENPPLLSGGTKEALKRLRHFEKKIDDYKEKRNFPAVEGTSNLSVYIRFGNISIRDMVRASQNSQSEGASTWLSEIIWRDFFQMMISVYPRLTKSSFKTEYDQIKFPGGKKEFKAWCEGQTGFPLVDAAMRCLNQTGMMHNRLRMVVASFLCKTLLVDWRNGEEYFAQKLLDFDLASNNGGWQWSASTGADAQPYFRIFNPYSQSEKFDPDGEFIRRWVPELAHLEGKSLHHPSPLEALEYPRPVVNYEAKRREALLLYEKIKN